MHDLILATTSDTLAGADLQQTLWDGILGAAVSAVISVLVTIYVLRRSIREARKDAAKAMDLAADQHAESLAADRDLARVQRELDAMAELITYLETQYNPRPDAPEHATELTSRFNILALSSEQEARRRWRQLPGMLTRVQPEDRNVLAWAVTVEQSIGRLLTDIPASPATERAGKRPGALIAELAAPVKPMKSQLRVLNTRLLDWPDLDADVKLHVFDELVARVRSACVRVIEAIDVLEIPQSEFNSAQQMMYRRLTTASRQSESSNPRWQIKEDLLADREHARKVATEGLARWEERHRASAELPA